MKNKCTYGLAWLTVCCISLSAFSQSPFYRPANYKWAEATPTMLEMDPRYKNEDAVILNEDNGIRVYKVNPRYMSIIYEKRTRIRYNSVEGISDHSTFVLPESLDPMYDRQELPFNKKEYAQRPQYFDVEVHHFAARILRPDGSIVDAVVNDSVVMDELKYGIKFHDTWSFVFKVSGMEPGDELEVHYKYSIPFDVNWFRFNSNRVFFHGTLPKQAFKLHFRADVRQDLSVQHTPAQRIASKKNIVTHFWEYENLPGCMDEVNARPHYDLPFMIFGLAQARYRYRHNLSYESLEIPYWTFIIKKRENRALWLRRVAHKMIPDKQNQKVKDFMARVNAGHEQYSSIDKAEELHEFITEEFDYVTDDEWYHNRDMKLQKMGNNVSDERLRELSRYGLYAKLLYNLDLNYHTAYLMDKRTGLISKEYLSPLWDNEWAFVLFDRSGPVFLHPKREDFGEMANEIPFYWEGSTALLAQVDMLWSDYEQVPRFFEVPNTPATANFRNTNVRVGISLKKERTTFDAKVMLSGQFETMTASTYDYGQVDSTISPEYGEAIFALNGSMKVFEKEWTSRSDDPPFRSVLRTKYLTKDLISEEEGEYSIDLGGIFNYVAPDGFDAKARDLPFYWDFIFLDNFNYQLVFDVKIELLDVDRMNVNLNTSLGDFMFRCEQTAPNTIMISSFLQVKKEKVDPKDAAILQEILDAANGLSEFSISVRELGRSEP